MKELQWAVSEINYHFDAPLKTGIIINFSRAQFEYPLPYSVVAFDVIFIKHLISVPCRKEIRHEGLTGDLSSISYKAKVAPTAQYP